MTSHHGTERRLVGSLINPPIVRGLYRSWLITTGLLLLVGSIVRFDLVTREHLGPLVADSEVAAGQAGDLASLGTGFDSNPTVHYAGLDIALTSARSIPVNNSGRPIIVAELTIRNNADVEQRVPLALINLVSDGGHVTEMDRFEYAEFAGRLALEPGETQQALGVFKLLGRLDSNLGSYQLQVGEQGRWPEVLPLEGEVMPPAYPRPLEILSGGSEEVRVDDFVVELVDAAEALEYDVFRAPIGQHLAVVNVSITGAPGVLDRGALDRGLWQLTDNDGNRRAIKAAVGERSVDGDTASMELVFPYSTESSELELWFGNPGDQELVTRFAVQAFE